MSERIFVGGTSFSTSAEDSSLVDIRYSGLEPKKRLHPKLIIRKFRQITGGMALAPNIEFNNFILEEAMEDVEEKFQVVQTFGPDFVFLFGPKPRFFTYSGRLFNTADKPFKNALQRAWDRRPSQIVQAGPPLSNDMTSSGYDTQRGILSGTNVVLAGGIARLEYDGSMGSLGDTTAVVSNTDFANIVSVREGYLIKMSVRLSAATPNSCPFTFTMVITNTLYF